MTSISRIGSEPPRLERPAARAARRHAAAPRFGVLISLALVLLAGSAATGCRGKYYLLWFGEEIENPESGTPEYVIQQALKAAADPDDGNGWQRYMALLHSRERESESRLADWRNFTYREFRKKVNHYVLDKKTFKYRMRRYDEGEEGDPSVTIYVESTKTDLPTPCRVKPDPKQGDAYRIVSCSL